MRRRVRLLAIVVFVAVVITACSTSSGVDEDRVAALEGRIDSLTAALEAELGVDLDASDSAPDGTGGATTTTVPDDADTPVAAADRASWRFDLRGFGPIEAGMTPDQIEALVGDEVTFEAFDTFDGFCWFGTAEALPGLQFLFVARDEGPAGGPEGGILGRVSAYANDSNARQWRTVSGVRVGDPESSVTKAYGERIERTAHVYVDGGSYLTYVPTSEADQDFRIRFFTDGSVVQEIHAGDVDVSGYIEGCA